MSAVSAASIAEEFFGGLFVEVFVGGILYGITTLQTFIYFQKFPDDGRFLKYYVAAVWVLESLHTGFCVEFVYSYLIRNYGNEKYFIHINWAVGASLANPVEVLNGNIDVSLGHGHYRGHNIGDGARILYPPSLDPYVDVTLLSFHTSLTTPRSLQVAFGMGSTILTYYLSGWVSFRQHKAATVTVSGGLASVAAVDVMVTTSITWYLRKKRSEVQESAKSKVGMIMLYAVNTGALTATASVITCILYAVRRDSLVFLGLVEVSGKLYANSFLGSLNARTHIRGKGNKQYSHESSGNTYRGPQVPKVEVFQQTLVSKDTVDHEYGNEYAMSPVKGGDLV
ncbi:hypothetical protein GSI_00174 [Ganoderma sinense ZZ0214-1]|uniref:DUF6534 domain-containing protein n=1 Tax=Ganoderma sinense ZZ0214-1 TaxID=1077348 RepID=A0A2G8SRT7_9APHY|nr:hypothetical protein GSI_00174 [Ganoderma sinense ZZ0214-1]